MPGMDFRLSKSCQLNLLGNLPGGGEPVELLFSHGGFVPAQMMGYRNSDKRPSFLQWAVLFAVTHVPPTDWNCCTVTRLLEKGAEQR